MARPTRAQLANALSEMYGHAQELHSCYANDVQPHRAEAMARILAKADKLAEKMLWAMPFDEIQSGKPANPIT